MRVRITHAFVEDWLTFNPGRELDVTPERGLDLLKRGVAERLENEPETAAMPNRGEKAVRSLRAAR